MLHWSFVQAECPCWRTNGIAGLRFFLIASALRCETDHMSMTAPQSTTPISTTEQIRRAFPSLGRIHNGFPVAYFDAAGGTQTPRVVVDAIADYLLHHNAN